MKLTITELCPFAVVDSGGGASMVVSGVASKASLV